MRICQKTHGEERKGFAGEYGVRQTGSIPIFCIFFAEFVPVFMLARIRLLRADMMCTRAPEAWCCK